MGFYAIVTPVYEDQESFAELCRQLTAAASQAKVRFHIIAVDDGSLGAPPMLEALTQAGLSGEILRLGRNIGHQAAIGVGLARAFELADIDGCVVMDCDGEDRPGDIPQLLAEIGRAHVDVAVAERAGRTESLIFQGFYGVYRRLFKTMTGQPLRFGNFMALSPLALERLSGMHESATHVAAATVKARLRRADVPQDRGTRFAGASKMNFPSLVLHGMRALMVFADLVLTRMALALIALATIVVLVLGGAGAAKLMGQASPGWLTNVTGFALLIFLQAGVFAMITLIVSSLGRIDTPPRVRARALEFVGRIERTEGPPLSVAAQ
jgi:hypothetical protein